MTHLSNLASALAVALGAAFLGNRLFQVLHGDRVLYTLVPWWEEGCKTGAALLLGAAIAPVHIAFGLVEMLYDWFRPSTTGLLVGCLALAGHTAAGLVTWGVSRWAPLWLAYVAAAILHMCWNRVVARLVADRSLSGMSEELS